MVENIKTRHVSLTPKFLTWNWLSRALEVRRQRVALANLSHEEMVDAGISYEARMVELKRSFWDF